MARLNWLRRGYLSGAAAIDSAGESGFVPSLFQKRRDLSDIPFEPVFLAALAVAVLLLALASAAIAFFLKSQLAKALERANVAIVKSIGQESAQNREAAESGAKTLRGELRDGLESHRSAVDARLTAVSDSQAAAASALRQEVNGAVKAFGDGLKSDVEGLSGALRHQFGAFSQSVADRQSAFEAVVNERLQRSAETLSELIRKSAEAHAELKSTVEQRLEKLRAENESKLEQMRLTVDEKLQSTLEKRIGESFKLVSERLDHVHRGLGEMQALAVGVGDLKKVLSNVKDRGGWAEVQLGALLDQMLARDQYVINTRIDPEAPHTVEYAVRLPGADDRGDVLLPIDSKFPKEDYERLSAAWESGDADAARASIEALETVLEGEARKIADKYVRPPFSTDFAIMFVPTEGLFAEAMRRPGLASRLQQKYRIMIAGPTTLAALLNSLQMGFRTLAIQKRSSEVWQVLGAAKAEFEKYSKIWEKIGEQLETVQNTVKAAGVRSRAVSRKLRDVETLEPSPLASSTPLLNQLSMDDSNDDDAQAAE
jgi:DNA recombination protein RmuC